MSRLWTVWYWVGRIPAILLDMPWDWPKSRPAPKDSHNG